MYTHRRARLEFLAHTPFNERLHWDKLGNEIKPGNQGKEKPKNDIGIGGEIIGPNPLL